MDVLVEIWKNISVCFQLTLNYISSTDLELDRVISGVNVKLKNRTLDDLGRNPGLSEPVPCCESELESLRKQIEDSDKYKPAENDTFVGEEFENDTLHQLPEIQDSDKYKSAESNPVVGEELRNDTLHQPPEIQDSDKYKSAESDPVVGEELRNNTHHQPPEFRQEEEANVKRENETDVRPEYWIHFVDYNDLSSIG